MERHQTDAIVCTLQRRLLSAEQERRSLTLVEEPRPDTRSAAVLVPLFEQKGELSLAFIRRAATLRAHGGEIAFPGGSREKGDLSPAMTALREAQEEIGLEPARAEILGLLPPVFTVVSNFLITPVVAFLPRGLGRVNLQTSEVAELIVAPFHALADPAIARTEQWQRNGLPHTVYFYDYGQYCIWGATGRILNALFDLLRTAPPCGSPAG